MTAAKAASEETGTELVPHATAVAIITEPKRFEEFYRSIVDEINDFVPDLTTAMSRAKIAKMARKVASTKTYLDGVGKALNEEARERISKVDLSRRTMRAKLDELRDKVREPLTEWEEAEEKREASIEAAFEYFRTSCVFDDQATSEEICVALSEIKFKRIDEEWFRDRYQEALDARRTAQTTLEGILERARQAEADAAELERLRQENADRETREAQEAAEREATARREQEAAQEKARADAAAEAEERRVAAAADQARRETEEAHAAELRRAEAAREAAIREAKEAEDARQAEAKRVADEQAEREADEVHRGQCILAATIAIATAGTIERADAKLIVEAIVAGGIPHVKLEF